MLSALKFTLQPWPGLRNGERGHIAMATFVRSTTFLSQSFGNLCMQSVHVSWEQSFGSFQKSVHAWLNITVWKCVLSAMLPPYFVLVSSRPGLFSFHDCFSWSNQIIIILSGFLLIIFPMVQIRLFPPLSTAYIEL